MEAQPGIPCPSCGHGNRPERRFCTECGSRLGRACRACGAPIEAEEKFCGNCGAPLTGTVHLPEKSAATLTPQHLAEKILASKSALEGERKQVTVLFADVKGSMELAEQVDPEVFHHVMERFAALLAEGVHRFEGTVTQFTGDGIMALFGAPIAHEDHAQRACYAALHLLEVLRRYGDDLRLQRGLNFAVRMGLNSGEVVVGTIGDDLRMDYTAQGHTVGLAARMEKLAAADRVYLTAHTARLVQGFFRLRDLGRLTVKGVTEPVRVYELEGLGALRTKLDVSRARGFSRFVGRQEETATLEAALAHALDGQGQVVGLVGEPGVGKSRLCRELVERARGQGIRVHVAHCVAHGKMIPFLPVLELVRDFFEITAQDGDEAARRKIAGTMLLLDKALTDALPLLFDFLGVSDPTDPSPRMDPEARQRQLFALVKRIAMARSRREPAMLLLEDLHWIDDGSAPFVETLVEAIPGTRTLLLLNFRPEYHAGWMQKSYYQQMPLLPLSAEASAELLRDLLGSDPSVAGLTARIRERAGGNPFFTEEIVQGLVATGSLEGTRGAYRLRTPAETLALPASVQAVLAARIDRLPEREKRVLQTAAVIGKEFAEPVLRRVEPLPEAELAAALRALAQAELVYETALYPHAEYAFKHPLTQEVAYGSQLGERRRQVHAAVARAIEATDPEKLDEHAALLAHHWERAGEALTAADWHRRAAEWVGARDRGEMNRHWQRVRTLLEAVPESAETLALGVLARTRLLLNAAFLGHQADEELATLFAEGMALASRLDGPAPRIFLLIMYGASRFLSGAVDEALAHVTEGLRLADESGNTFLLFMCRGALPAALNVAGRPREAVAVSEEAERLCGGDPEMGVEVLGFSPYTNLLSHRALALAWLGRLGEAAATAGQGIEIARRRRDAEVLVGGHQAGEQACELAGDVEGALGHGRGAVEAAAAASWMIRVAALTILGRAHLLAGDWLHAVDAMTGALAIVRERRAGLVYEGWVLPSLAEASLGAGDRARAREAADLALAWARQHHTRVFEIMALLAWVRVRLVTDGANGAAGIEVALRDAMALVEATEARAYAPFVHVERAALARLLGDEAARQRELGEARRLFSEMGAPIRAAQVAKELGG